MQSKLKFTRTALERIEPLPGAQTTYWDTTCIGFGLRVSSGGAKTFFYQGRLNGRTFKMTIGRFGKLTPEEARTQARAFQRDAELGKPPVSTRRATSGETPGNTLGSLLDGYADVLQQQDKESHRKVRVQLHKAVKIAFPKIWAKAANDISLEDCLQVVGALVDQGKLRQADKIRSYIKSAFSAAIAARGDATMPKSLRAMAVRGNPLADLKKVRGSSNSRDRTLSLSEFRHYWRRVNQLPEPFRSLMMLHVLTGGQRIAQLSRVTLTDMDWDRPSVVILDKKGRREEPRRHEVPLLPECMPLIRTLTACGPFVFSVNLGLSPVGDTTLSDAVKRVVDEMEAAQELEKGRFTAGAIRSTVETRLAARPYSVPPHVLSQLLSHGTGGVQNKHYQRHDYFDEKLDALKALWRMLEERPISQESKPL